MACRATASALGGAMPACCAGRLGPAGGEYHGHACYEARNSGSVEHSRCLGCEHVEHREPPLRKDELVAVAAPSRPKLMHDSTFLLFGEYDGRVD